MSSVWLRNPASLVNRAGEGDSLGPLVFRYAVVGVINTAAHFITTALLVELAILTPVPASAVGFIAAVLIAFFLNRHWTFGTTDKPVERLLKFVVVSLFGLLLNTLIMYVVVESLAVHYLWGLLLVIFVVPPSNFLLNFFWSFKAD